MTATPAAPLPPRSRARSAVTPPMASTGIATERATAASPPTPTTAPASSLLVVGNTVPHPR